MRLTLHNSKQVIYDTGAQTFANRGVVSNRRVHQGSGTLVNGALLNLDSTGTGSVVNSGIAQFKLIHAAPGTAGINAFVDATNIFSNVPYQGASSYAALAAGSHTVTVESVAAPGAVIASVTPPFAPATDTSVVVTGLPGAQTAVALADNNLPGTTGTVRIRFVNVATDVGRRGRAGQLRQEGVEPSRSAHRPIMWHWYSTLMRSISTSPERRHWS